MGGVVAMAPLTVVGGMARVVEVRALRRDWL